MSDIPHAWIVNVIPDLPRHIVHVGTELPERPQSPGFDAEKKHELLKAVAAKVGREGLNGYKVYWSDNGVLGERLPLSGQLGAGPSTMRRG